MIDEQIYQQCLGATRRLAIAVETCDLTLIQREVAQVRACLRFREETPLPGRQENPLCIEQLEAIEAVVVGIEQSLASLRRVTEAELTRMNATHMLLRHLAFGDGLGELRHGDGAALSPFAAEGP